MQLEITYLPTDSLTPYKNNAKLHPQEQIDEIKASITKFGMNDPIAVCGENNIIVEGHGRLIACQQLGIEMLPVIRLDHLTEDQRKAYTLAHNKLTMNTDFDLDMLKMELQDIDIDMGELGFSVEIEEMDLHDDDEIVEDEVPEPPAGPKAKLGDIYQLGAHKLMCGDSTDPETVAKLMDGEKAGMVFTDPPYGMKLDTNYYGMVNNLAISKDKHLKGGNIYEKIIGDHDDFKPELIRTIFDNFGYCNEIFVWGGDYYPELLNGYKDGNYIVWDKRLDDSADKGFGSCFELCWSKTRHKKDIARVKWFGVFGMENDDTAHRVHPTQKPAALARWFIEKYSKAGDIIADLYGGSGFTLIACEQLDRKCYMMELDPKYVDVIIERWENLTGTKAEKVN